MSKRLNQAAIPTPLGPMTAIADDDALYLLEFENRKGLKAEIEKLLKKTQGVLATGNSAALASIRSELKLYFCGDLKEFATPIHLQGTLFQNRVWEELKKIPFGETCSYSLLAQKIGKPSAFRAAALANSANQLAIIVPCHRVINLNGRLGGYAAGISHKKWLIEHEAGAVQ